MVRNKFVAPSLLAAVVALGAATPALASPAAASASRCAATGLRLSVVQGQPAAGSTFYQANLKNTSGHDCTLFGFPGASGRKNGAQLGLAAARSGGFGRTITVKAGKYAHATLQVVDVGNFPPAQCRAKTTDHLRVFPPGATKALSATWRVRGCSKHTRRWLSVTHVMPGKG